MAQAYLCIYYDQEESWDALDDAERGKLLSALIDYAVRGETPEVSGMAKCLWPILRDQVDKNNASYADKVSKCSAAGKQSGVNRRSKKRTDVQKNEQTLTDVQKNERTLTDVRNNNNNNNNNKQFIPPTLEEVKAYIASKGNIIDADYFYEYYSNLDWQDKNGTPVRNWKNRALTWIQKEKERNPPAPKIGREMTREEIKALYSRGCEPSAEFLAASAREQSSGLFALRTPPNS